MADSLNLVDLIRLSRRLQNRVTRAVPNEVFGRKVRKKTVSDIGVHQMPAKKWENSLMFGKSTAQRSRFSPQWPTSPLGLFGFSWWIRNLDGSRRRSSLLAGAGDGAGKAALADARRPGGVEDL